MTTKLSPDFLRSITLLTAFRGESMQQAQAYFLMLGITGTDFMGPDLPGEISQGSKNLAGAALGSLLAIGLIECVGRVKSPRPDANGRKVNVYRVIANKTVTARTWLSRHGYIEAGNQMELLAV